MRDGDPIVTIVVPAYNRGHLLPRLLRSLLRQNDARFEVIIVDDGSTDLTPRVLEEFTPQFRGRFRGIRCSGNRGCNAARNTGVRAARTPWCLFVDSDWELFPDAVERAIYHTNVSAHVGAVGFLSLRMPGDVIRGFRASDQSWEIASISHEDVVLGRNLTGGLICMLRRSVFCQTGLWFPEWINGLELIFAARLARRWRILAVRRVLGITHFDPGEDRISSNAHRKWPEDFRRGYEIFIAENADILRKDIRVYRHFALRAVHCSFYSRSYWRWLIWGSRAVVWKIYLIFMEPFREASTAGEGAIGWLRGEGTTVFSDAGLPPGRTIDSGGCGGRSTDCEGAPRSGAE